MEVASRIQEREDPSPINSPNSNGSSSGNGGGSSPSIPNQVQTQQPISCPTRSEINPYPTTFVQADTTTFKHVVQMLTGSSETVKQASFSSPSPHKPSPSDSSPSKGSLPPIRTSGQKKQGFKLYERRNILKNGLMINPQLPNSVFSSRKPEILSPSILDFPSLMLSPVTPLIEDPFLKSSPVLGGNSSEEEKAIAEKKFYLHPSPRNTPRGNQPQLLPLFPVTSPRVSGSSS